MGAPFESEEATTVHVLPPPTRMCPSVASPGDGDGAPPVAPWDRQRAGPGFFFCHSCAPIVASCLIQKWPSIPAERPTCHIWTLYFGVVVVVPVGLVASVDCWPLMGASSVGPTVKPK